MKAVILAGGYGTRISEETHLKPKPMIEIGGKPILWHIMKSYSHYGINDFIVCLGYKGYIIKEFFANYFLYNCDVTINLQHNQVKVHQNSTEPWTVTLIDTGEKTQTGGRLKRVRQYLDDNEDFCFTYGDGLSDINLAELVAFHKEQKTLATVTAIKPPGRFGALSMDGHKITRFDEKPQGDGGWISGGFFVLSPTAIDYIAGDQTIWEQGPMQMLAAEGQMSAYRYNGFWRPMDTLRDKIYLEELWETGRAPWNVWCENPNPAEPAQPLTALNE